MNRTSLCIRMLMLLKARGLMNTKELAAELETKERNIREYKKELITAGYNIQEKKGRYGGYYLDENSLFPSLSLTPQEIQALQEAREMVEHEPGLHFSKDFDRAIEKVVNTAKDTHYSQRVYMNANAPIISAKEKEMIDTAQTALDQGVCVEMTYTSRTSKTKETFLVDPYEIIHYHNAYYLLGFNHTRNDYRIYRFSDLRMEDCQLTQQKFLRDSYFHIEQHIGTHSLIKGKFNRIVIQVDKEYQDVFKEATWGLDFKEEEDGVYSFLVEDMFAFYRQIFGFQDHVKIIEPATIQQEYKDILENTLKMYQ